MSRLRVVGIGADGTAGLSAAALAVLRSAPAIHGAPRQLALVAELAASTGARLAPLPRPLLPALPQLARDARDADEVFLASGDPSFHGIGATLTRILGAGVVEVFPAPSAASLAAARLGWPLAGVPVLNVLTSPPTDVLPALHPGARVFVLCPDATTPGSVARVLVDHGLGATRLHVLSDLGAGPDTESPELHVETTAADLAAAGHEPPRWSDLCVLALHVAPDATFPHGTGSRLPGLDDPAYDSDGQLTKRVPRMLAVSLLRPYPGALLWDVGGGSGSIAIEWLRAADGSQATCFERSAQRRERIAANARGLGVSRLDVRGTAPDAFHDARPDAVFVGGGLTVPGLLDGVWSRLRPNGRFVATAVTVEGEQLLHRLRRRHGGEMFRAGVERLAGLGNFAGWEPARNLVFYAVDKPRDGEGGRDAT